VQIVLRPDALRLDASAAWRGTVVRRAFAGDRALVDVESDGGSVRLHVPYRDAPSLGDSVGLAVDADGVLVYPAEAD
jgi:hypothetical protein